MKLGILKTDTVRPEWVPTFGEYPDMFEALLLQVRDDLQFEVWDVQQGHYPDLIDCVDGYIITGSKSSVYEDEAWIRTLEAFVRRLYDAAIPTVGICFGHQLIAQALGGKVDKSPKGWGVGIHQYQVTAEGQAPELSLLVSHQDQVYVAPPEADIFASNSHCAIAGMHIGRRVLTFQGHPEFVPDYARAIMEFRLDRIGEARVAQGMASLVSHEHEGHRVAEWMLSFFSDSLANH